MYDQRIKIKVIKPVQLMSLVKSSSGSRGGSLEPPFEAKLFHFHGDLFEKLTNKTNPPFWPVIMGEHMVANQKPYANGPCLIV